MALLALDVRNKAHPAGIMFLIGVIETLPGRYRRIIHVKPLITKGPKVPGGKNSKKLPKSGRKGG
jgi:hypothetical protein